MEGRTGMKDSQTAGEGLEGTARAPPGGGGGAGSAAVDARRRQVSIGAVAGGASSNQGCCSASAALMRAAGSYARRRDSRSRPRLDSADSTGGREERAQLRRLRREMQALKPFEPGHARPQEASSGVPRVLNIRLSCASSPAAALGTFQRPTRGGQMAGSSAPEETAPQS